MTGSVRGDAKGLDNLLGKTVKTTLKKKTTASSQTIVHNIVKK